MRRRTRSALTVAVTLAIVASTPALAVGPRTSPQRPHWVGAWEAAPTTSSDRGFVGLAFYNAAGNPPTQDAQAYPTPVLHDQSFRNILAPHAGGVAARIRLSNRFGTIAVTFDHVYLGRQLHDAELVPGSNRFLTFHGATAVTVPAGATVLSDPVRMRISPFDHLAVSFHTDGTAVDRHDTAQQISYFTLPGGGTHSADTSGSEFTQVTSSWYGVTGLDVLTAHASGAVVILGDSIADGFDSTENVDHRWPDVLSHRLLAQDSPSTLSVLNAGISANAASIDAAGVFGPSAVARLEPDVLEQTRARTVIVCVGSNDLILERTAATIVDALQMIDDRAHAAGLHVVVATIMPRGLSGAQEQTRLDVNRAIRAGSLGDAVVDFDAVMRDPHAPGALNPAYDAGDGTHPNDAGYRVMADALDLDDLT